MPISTGLAAFAELGDLVGIDILNPLASDWMILADDGSVAIKPDTVPKFEFRNEQRVADYPMEQGAFASYNKVATPFQIRMQMVCSGLNYAQSAAQAVKSALNIDIGQNYASRPDFLDTLDYMLATTDLFTIVTPDATYPNATMERYDYRKESNNGATMLIVEAWFREVRLTAGSTYSSSGLPTVTSNSASAANPVDVGTAQTFAYGSNAATALQGLL